jgi:hypothetical protein
MDALVENPLSLIFADIFTLSDIPENESRHLSKLCNVLNALQGLVLDSPEQTSLVGTCVPSWLKVLILQMNAHLLVGHQESIYCRYHVSLQLSGPCELRSERACLDCSSVLCGYSAMRQ